MFSHERFLYFQIRSEVYKYRPGHLHKQNPSWLKSFVPMSDFNNQIFYIDCIRFKSRVLGQAGHIQNILATLDTFDVAEILSTIHVQIPSR